MRLQERMNRGGIECLREGDNMKGQFRQQLGERLVIPPETMTELPVTVLRGKRTVSIENHKGILAYTDTCVKVSVRGGAVTVRGAGLAIVRMTRQNVEIRGSLCALELE